MLDACRTPQCCRHCAVLDAGRFAGAQQTCWVRSVQICGVLTARLLGSLLLCARLLLAGVCECARLLRLVVALEQLTASICTSVQYGTASGEGTAGAAATAGACQLSYVSRARMCCRAAMPTTGPCVNSRVKGLSLGLSQTHTVCVLARLDCGSFWVCSAQCGDSQLKVAAHRLTCLKSRQLNCREELRRMKLHTKSGLARLEHERLSKTACKVITYHQHSCNCCNCVRRPHIACRRMISLLRLGLSVLLDRDKRTNLSRRIVAC